MENGYCHYNDDNDNKYFEINLFNINIRLKQDPGTRALVYFSFYLLISLFLLHLYLLINNRVMVLLFGIQVLSFQNIWKIIQRYLVIQN